MNKNQKHSSKSSFYGRFVHSKSDEEVILAMDWRDSTITIIQRSIEKVPQSVKVFRSKVTQISSVLTIGECIERGFLDPKSSDVYKTVHIHTGKNAATNFSNENLVTISEYMLENPQMELADPRKNIGFFRFDFVTIRNQEMMEVSKYLMKPGGKELLSHRLFSKRDSVNRRWEDVPVNYSKLDDVKEEMWKLKFMIRQSTCCFEDCEKPEPKKCSRCHHYTCSLHSTEQFEVFENSGDGDVLFEGEIEIKLICAHCSGLRSEIVCLKWY